MSNYMEKVAEMLDVKLGERFKVRDREYFIDKHGLNRYYPGNDMGFFDDVLLSALIRGELNIEKLPWKPRSHDKYWYIPMDGCALYSKWFDSAIDYAMYYAGNCFETKEEALAHAPEIIGKLRRKYEE